MGPTLADRLREQLVRELPALAALQPGGVERLPAILDSWLAGSGMDPEATAGLAADLLGAGPLEALLADERITEIMVNGPGDVRVEVDGRLQPTDVRFASEPRLRAVIDRLLAGTGRRLDESMPTVDAVLADGTRLNAVLPPVALAGPLLTLRRPRRATLSLADLVRLGSVPRAVAAFLHAAVIGRCNIVVSGGTGAGKTTLLAALAALVPTDQRIVTVEDVAELRIDHPHVVAQQCRDPLAAGVAPIDMRALLRNTLRMRPDRIVVGEVRGAEAADMVAAMNTGHPGSMSTVHANSAGDAHSRLEALVSLAWPSVATSTVRGWLATAIDVIVQCERDQSGRRVVSEVVAIDDYNFGAIFDRAGEPELLRRPPRRCLDRMSRHGIDFTLDPASRAHVA
ncbi:MAG TPA: ATPase, T2SS/T4P/T4SS family [Candidatus Angelobacter sp.]|jgi:pilus assembly protein CpaF|nr:ATPase, T2SS/T4P/T4SS family [Candidatus Angelobacter sp.]